MNPAEIYKVDENNPPHLKYAHGCDGCRFVRWGGTDNGKKVKGWALVNQFNDRLNFIADGTDWIK